MTDDEELGLFDDADSDEEDGETGLPTVSLDREARSQPWWLKARWVVVAFVVLVVAALTAGILVFNASAPGAARGARTPTLAAQQFVAAVNAGNERAAARISCAGFADQARAEARSGSDPDINYTLDQVIASDKDDATAIITEHLTFSSKTKQNMRHGLEIIRGGGVWLICGRLT